MPSRPRMMPPVGKSGPLQVAAQPVDVCRRVVDQGDDRVDDLAEVVRRHVRRHPDRDAGRAVDEEVREPGREDRRLLRRAVVVRLVVDRVVPDVAEQLHRHRGQAALGVALGGRGIPVDVAEVPLRVDQRVAQRERLRHADERVVDRLVPVRVVLPHRVADDAGALDARPAWLETELVHGEEDAAVDGLEAVAHVRQRTRHDHAHRVVEEARPHLLLELAGLDAARAEWVLGGHAARRPASRTWRSAR